MVITWGRLFLVDVLFIERFKVLLQTLKQGISGLWRG